MKRLFNKLLIPIITSTMLLPVVSCNKADQENDTIEIVSKFSDADITASETYTSRPLKARCIDGNKQEKQIDIKFNLSLLNNQKLPDWICLTKDNEIKLLSGKQPGKYSFVVIAFNEELLLFSEPKTFNLTVLPDRHIMPDSISIDIENNKYCMFGEETIIPIKITPFKEGVEESKLIKECKCKIEVLKGASKDKQQNDLFVTDGTNSDPHIVISAATDASFTGQYTIRVTVSLLGNESIFDAKDVSLNIDNIYFQHNSQARCSFTRESSHDDWTISSIDSGVQVIHDVPTTIQNSKVTKIAPNLCAKSKIDNLVQIILPESILAIGENAFANQLKLCSIEIPGIKFVGKGAFKNDSIAEFRLRSKKPKFWVIENDAFYGCKSLKFETQNELLWIGNFSLKNTNLKSFEIGEICMYIGTECFSGCGELENFKILSPKPPEIGGAIFNNCDKLKTINVPNDSLHEYLTDPSWSTLGKKIEGI